MILPQIRAALVEAFEAQLPGVQIRPVDPAEDRQVDEAVWIEEVSSDFEWRSLGDRGNNRTETIEVIVRVHVFRQRADQRDAADAAITRCEAILSSLEDGIEADFSLAGSLSFGRAARATSTILPADGGWIGRGELRFQGSNYPPGA